MSHSEESGGSSTKRRRLSGAAKYRTKFNALWKGEFPFITSVNRDPYK
jgi:hypothetical protein